MVNPGKIARDTAQNILFLRTLFEERTEVIHTGKRVLLRNPCGNQTNTEIHMTIDKGPIKLRLRIQKLFIVEDTEEHQKAENCHLSMNIR